MVRRCGCQCIGCVWIKVRILIISPGPGFASSPLSSEPRNVIALVFYIISSQRVCVITDSQRGSFCFNLLIPKSGSFLSAVVYTKESLIGGEFASFFHHHPPPHPSCLCHVNCYCLLPQIAWEVCQMNGFAMLRFLLRICRLHNTHGGQLYFKQTHLSPSLCKAVSVHAQIGQMYVNSLCHCTSFLCMRVSLSFPLQSFFIFTLFNKAEHLASGRHMDGQLCRWSRWK